MKRKQNLNVSQIQNKISPSTFLLFAILLSHFLDIQLEAKMQKNVQIARDSRYTAMKH